MITGSKAFTRYFIKLDRHRKAQISQNLLLQFYRNRYFVTYEIYTIVSISSAPIFERNIISFYSVAKWKNPFYHA